MLTRQRCLLSSWLFCLLIHVSSGSPLSGTTDESPSTKKIASPEDADFCRHGPMKNGALIECEAYIPMYTFNAQTKECEGYIYGGCGGSKNLFPSREECEKGCGHLLSRAKRSESCDQPPEKGRCLAAFNRFAYNPDKGDCTEFLYGGCGGNSNNFKTRAECLKNCNVVKFKSVNFNEVPDDGKIIVEAN